jgi:hypothetical protein
MRKYYRLINQIAESYHKGNYEKMIEYINESLDFLPKFVEKQRKRYGKVDTTSIYLFTNECLFWVIINQTTILDSIRRVAESVPELKEGWGWAQTTFEMDQLSRQIQEYIRDHPGTIQSQLKKIFGKERDDVGIMAYYLSQFGKIKRIKSGNSYTLFTVEGSPSFNKPFECSQNNDIQPVATRKRHLRKKQADVDVISDFYVYLHKDPKTGIPFYVGRGRGKRAYDRTSRHKEWHDFVETIGGRFEVEIVERNLRESDAGEIEANLIAQYGKKRDGVGPLVNWTDGGEDEMGYQAAISLEIPIDIFEAKFIEDGKKKYEATVYRVLLGEERERFVNKLSEILESLLDDLDDIYGGEDECSSLEVTLNTLESYTLQFSKRRISSQDMAFYIDGEIDSLQLDFEYADTLRKELKAILKRAIRELREIRGELTPK